MANQSADNALGEYAEIFGIMSRLTDEYPGGLAESFPSKWTDPLELYGCYRKTLETHAVDLDHERAAVRDLMAKDRYSPATIWHARLNLVAHRILENGLN
jgi:hypothetical protein